VPVLKAENVAAALSKGASARLADEVPARFVCGQRVRAANINPQDHTRIPRYVRGHVGVVDSDQGVFIFPDAHARGEKVAQRLYSVRFTSTELWGPQGTTDAALYVDLFESYLAPG
jgi:nitrile hydratase